MPSPPTKTRRPILTRTATIAATEAADPAGPDFDRGGDLPLTVARRWSTLCEEADGEPPRRHGPPECGRAPARPPLAPQPVPPHREPGRPRGLVNHRAVPM